MAANFITLSSALSHVSTGRSLVHRHLGPVTADALVRDGQRPTLFIINILYVVGLALTEQDRQPAEAILASAQPTPLIAARDAGEF